MQKITYAALAALVASFVLSGCNKQSILLEEKLQGKSAKERYQFLIEECHFEAGKGSGIRRHSEFKFHTQKRHEICDQINKEFLKLQNIRMENL